MSPTDRLLRLAVGLAAVVLVILPAGRAAAAERVVLAEDFTNAF